MNHEARPLPRASAAKRGIGYLLTLSLLAVPVLADRANSYSTRAQKEFDQALSADAYFGIRAYTLTADLPTCNALRGKGAPFAYDVQAATVKVCNGTSWTAVGSSTITSGTTATSGCTAGGVLFSASSLVVCSDTDLTFDGTALTVTNAIVPTSLVIGTADAAANSLTITPGVLSFEGSAADAFEITVQVANPTVGDQPWTIPNAGAAVSRTFASLEGVQTFSGASNLFSGTVLVSNATGSVTLGSSISNTFNAFFGTTTLTPDSAALLVGTAGRSWHVYEYDDAAFDFNNGACGTAACVDPAVILHSPVQDTTQYSHLSVTGSAGGWITTLTESTATSVLSIPVASGVTTGGRLTYRIFAADATDQQIREGSILVATGNKAGTETCTVSAASELLDGSIINTSSGTLTYAITCLTGLTNEVRIQFNAVSSLTQTTLNFTGRYDQTGPGLPARQ